MKITFTIFLLIPLFATSQTFEKSENTFTKEYYVKYFHQGAGIIIQSITIYPTDTTSLTYFELGIVISRKSSGSDDFMKKSGVIVFEDKTFLILNDQININYFSEGKHEFSIKHSLTANELNILKTKKIDYFMVADKEKSLDKWQKQDILKAFNEIIKL